MIVGSWTCEATLRVEKFARSDDGSSVMEACCDRFFVATGHKLYCNPHL